MTSRNLLCAALAAVALGLTGCQGSMGSPGLPAAPGGYAPAPPGPGAAQAVPYSRTRTVEGAVYLVPAESSIPLPAVGGFAVSIALPGPSPSPGSSAAGLAGRAVASPAATSAGSAAAGRALAASASPSSAAAPQPSATATAVPSAGPTPSPGASAAASPAASAAPSGSGSPRHPTPAPSGPKIETKTTIYPTDAPLAPSPVPTGNVQTFVHQTAIVRGYFMAATDLTLSSLDAVRFTIPKEEQTANRSFIVALFDTSKKHKAHLVAFSADTALSGGVVSSTGETDVLKLSKGTGYEVVLYGDEIPATPPPQAPPVIPPANNPFATPAPTYPPGWGPPGYQPQQPTYPPGYATPTPYYGGPH